MYFGGWMMGKVFETIIERRSIRRFNDVKVKKDDIIKLITAAGWAPSGKNLQPWKFVIIEDSMIINSIGKQTIHSRWMIKATCIILVYLDKEISYALIKDIQAVGASIQNILLCAKELNIGTCWIGEILDREMEVNTILNIQSNLQLMGVIALGYFNEDKKIVGSRRNYEKNILKWL